MIHLRHIVAILCCSILVWSCGTDQAGKTTTTTNGFAIVDRQGQPVANARVVLVQQWTNYDSFIADTVHTDNLGMISFPEDYIQSLALIWVGHPTADQGLLIRNSILSQFPNQHVTQIWLDTLVQLEIQLQGHGGASFYIDSSLFFGVLDSAGYAELPLVPVGYHDLWIDYAEDSVAQVKGRLAVRENEIIWNSWNLGDVVVGAQTPVEEILWIEDFEDGNVWPIPETNDEQGMWRLFTKQAQWIQPDTSTEFEQAIIWNSTRNSRQLSLRFSMDSSISWAVAQISPVYWDISTADSLCFWYRTDGRVKIEWLRQYISEPDWGAYQWISANTTGGEICLDLENQIYNSAVPDSLQTWEKYSTWVVEFQFLVNHQGSYFELDDVRLIR